LRLTAPRKLTELESFELLDDFDKDSSEPLEQRPSLVGKCALWVARRVATLQT